MGVQEARLAINATLQQLQDRYAKNPPEKEQLKALYDKFYNDLIDLNAGALDASADAVAKAAAQLQAVVASANTSPFDVYLKGLQQVATSIGVLLPPPPANPPGPIIPPPPATPPTQGPAGPPPPGPPTGQPPASPGPTPPPPPTNLTSPNRDIALLHPMMRDRAQKVLAACAQRQLPFRIFEAYRSPERQRYLYEQGRSRPGAVVTYAQAWESYHQYGLAADFVLYYDGNPNPWSWDDSGANKAFWDTLHEIGKGFGLEPLGFETPHLQIAGLKIGDLEAGVIPDGGDQSWKSNFDNAVNRWTGTPPAPRSAPKPAQVEQSRPAISVPQVKWSSCPTVGSSDWHSKFGGQEWRFDQNGVYLRASPHPSRSPGAPTTVQAILATYADQICKASLAHGVPPELIVMTIGAETGIYRSVDFTGPKTFRWEPAVFVTDYIPQTYGDYSAGPMQTLATTARETIRNLGLSYQPFQTAPYYPQQPDPAPADNPLYDGAINIELGTAEIRRRLQTSGFDPVLVAACFNAGGLYQSDKNAWRLRSQGDHIDRAIQWFGDACFVLSSLRAMA